MLGKTTTLILGSGAGHVLGTESTVGSSFTKQAGETNG